ncbi:AAA family ATPase [Endozoicomonas sp. 8E]|uniref:AAA family ATPase n=1 Tax=Endozoicomonas sp. 8E TaxID=3035692 RepID=UPI002938DC11|nr:AAA family ATPase [Endozoicomonas sp. 8E]WOG28904.1 AAA family ATPase [Endozoicomonas sp. 8E]
MDGRIDGKIKRPFFKSAEPDGGMPAKKARQDTPSIAEVCDVTAQLRLSSPAIALPEIARTVSSTNSPLQKAAHAFDFRFVASDDEVRQLLIDQTCDENRDVTLISHPDELSQANLVSCLSISGEGRHTLRSGKLFEGSQPLTLVMDIRKLTSEDLPKFNDLLDPDNPCLYDKVSRKKRPLGKHVSLLVLATPEQLTSVGQHDEAPGADFWRRINRPGNTWQFDTKTGSDPWMDSDEHPPLLPELPPAESAIESAMDDDNTLLIDCHLHSHWRQLLLGGPGVNQQGQIQHIPGRLESLRAGQRVILKGANWQDLAFEQTIRQMLAQQCFESNGKICQLPDNVQFYQTPVGKDELYSLFQSLSCSGDAPGNPIIINQSNIGDWLNPIAIAPEGYAVPNTSLLEQIQAGDTVTVTSPLTEVLWFRLLGSLQTIRETTGLEPRLQVAHAKKQPNALKLTKKDEHSLSRLQEKISHHATLNTINTVTYQQPAEASDWLNHQKEAPLVIQVNGQTRCSQLFDNIRITSEQKAYFGRHQSELQEALIVGTPVVFRGLESNPTLQQQLESLFVGQTLLVNGQLQEYPKAHITTLWPESAQSPSPIFRSMVATGSPCPEVDLWAINASKHGIHWIELPERAIDELYEAFETVPDDLCNPLPEMTEGLLNNLILAARRAQQVDRSPRLLPRHWRKAIDSVITHGVRQNPSVRDFVKVACWHLLPDKMPDKDRAPWIDLDRLNAIINSSQRLDRTFLQQNLWQLARAFDPAFFYDEQFEGLQLSYKRPFPEYLEKEALNRLCNMILAHTPEEQRPAMAYQLEVTQSKVRPHHPLTIRPTRQIKRLQDALMSGWQLYVPPGQTRSDVILSLASDCFHSAKTANSEAAGIERIEHRLSELLEWQGSTDKPLSALARDLYHGEMNQQDRESRRLSRLHERFADSPVLFLQGETGTGKSYFSAKMAKASGQAAVISLGPSDSEQTLMKRWQWQQHADGDRFMKQQNRALMEWASTPSDNVGGKYITLILDEANLARAGLLASLNGLWEPQPCIYVNGHPVRVSPKHRVILTGNPDHYSGRQMDPALKEKLPRAYYPRLDEAFLRDRVVEPALLNHLQRHQINDIAHIATKSVMALWQYYQELLPKHEFTPRDLTDICSWVSWYLDRARPAVGSVTPEQINSLIQQSFRDLLGPEISENQQDALLALEIWFAARYHPDNTLRDKVHNHTLPDMLLDFRTLTKEIRPEFDTSGSAVIELVQGLGQDLSRAQQAYHLDIKHGGRQATLIEGPAGRGKDATLNLVIESVRQEAERRGESMPKVYYLNACDCSWDKVCEAIQKAKIKGGIVVISEMNLIDSQHLEGELNDILAGDAHPGFHLFATVNPPEYSGRKPLSPALKGRFRHLPIRQYNQKELQAIAEKVLPQTPQGKIAAKQLTDTHCRLRAYLQRKNLPLQPTSLDLQNVARAVDRGGKFTENALHQCLNQHYRLYLMAAKISLQKLPKSSGSAMGGGGLAVKLSHWFNKTLPDIGRPWLIRSSDSNSIDVKNHEICFKDDLSEEDAKTEIIKRVAQTQWQASGLSLRPDESDNVLTRALYRHWQKSWFDREFGQTGVDANSVFSMTKEEEQALTTPASLPYLQEADKRISLWNAKAVQWWPAFWHEISNLPNHSLDEFIKEASADSAFEQYDPEVEEKKTRALDQITNYEALAGPKLEDYKVFKTEKLPSQMYRLGVQDIFVTAGGNIKRIDIGDKYLQGMELLTPELLPEHDQPVTLAKNQTLATFEMQLKYGQCALPSLTADDYIVALRIEPDVPYTLVRDRYTGLHKLFIAGDRANQSIKIAYVVESREPGIKVQPAGFDTRCSKGMKAVLDKLFENIEQQPTEIQVPLLKIIKAENRSQRIEAIKDYCKQFSGKTKPERDENFFHFLVTQRQGYCKHRTPVFVAFCRYFGIPCRSITNFIHSFAEYSEDGGQTWKSANLGGGPARVTEIKSEFQPIRRGIGFNTQSNKIKKLLKSLLKEADSTQQQALSKAIGINLEALNKAVETSGALADKDPGPFDILKNLWKEKDLASFSMGVSLIRSLKTEASRYNMRRLAGARDYGDSPDRKTMSEAVVQILSNGDEDQVTKQLKLLHPIMINHAKASPHHWLYSMVKILTNSHLAKPSVIHFAREALASGWLDPLPIYDSSIIEADEHYQLLMRLRDIDELKVQATDCLKKWYQTVLSGEKISQSWQSTYEFFLKEENNALFVTHCHGGFSRFLEDKIARSILDYTWTNEPEGVPNVERMLLQEPAFMQLTSVNANHRPVITLGRPSWVDTVICEKRTALIELKAENSPDLKRPLKQYKQYEAMKQQLRDALKALDEQCQTQEERKQKKHDLKSKYQPILESLELSYEDLKPLNDLNKKCWHAIEQAFSHYLYGVTHSKGGRLTYCWGNTSILRNRDDEYGAHDPSSPLELLAMMSKIPRSVWFERSVENSYLRQALNASNALVLSSYELTTIANEFLNTVNLNSLCESLDT